MSSNKDGTHTESKASFGGGGVELSTDRSRAWNLREKKLIVRFANSRYWEETEDAECKGVEACG